MRLFFLASLFLSASCSQNPNSDTKSYQESDDAAREAFNKKGYYLMSSSNISPQGIKATKIYNWDFEQIPDVMAIIPGRDFYELPAVTHPHPNGGEMMGYPIKKKNPAHLVLTLGESDKTTYYFSSEGSVAPGEWSLETPWQGTRHWSCSRIGYKSLNYENKVVGEASQSTGYINHNDHNAPVVSEEDLTQVKAACENGELEMGYSPASLHGDSVCTQAFENICDLNREVTLNSDLTSSSKLTINFK